MRQLSIVILNDKDRVIYDYSNEYNGQDLQSCLLETLAEELEESVYSLTFSGDDEALSAEVVLSGDRRYHIFCEIEQPNIECHRCGDTGCNYCLCVGY